MGYPGFRGKSLGLVMTMFPDGDEVGLLYIPRPVARQEKGVTASEQGIVDD